MIALFEPFTTSTIIVVISIGSLFIVFLPFAVLEGFQTDWDDDVMKEAYLMDYEVRAFQVTQEDIDWYRQKIECRVKLLYRLGIIGVISIFLLMALIP